MNHYLKEGGLPVLLSVAGTIIAMLPSNPNNMTLPSRDSGVFLYVGWRFLNGDIPYRDVWDHKPPLIYFVDALGLSITPDSLWGVWLIQLIFVFLTLLFLYKLLDREFGSFAAIAGTVILTSGLLTILDRGNVTEEYALVFQAACLWSFAKAGRQDFPIRTTFWIGLLGGIAFHFKQTTIGLWIAYSLVLLAVRLGQRKSPLRDAFSLLVGWLIPSIVIVVYFASQNALKDYWEQAFLYNFVYIGKHEGIRRLIPVFLKGFAYLRNGWVLYLALSGWLVGIGYLWLRRVPLPMEPYPLLPIAVLSLPIEILLITISGRSILHYYLTPLPVMAILAGSLVYTAPFVLGRISPAKVRRIETWAPIIVLSLVIFGQVRQISHYSEYVREARDNDYAAVIEYVSRNTRETDQVLVIGAESVVNFLARRESPTRYVYQYPLALLGRRPMFEEYFHQILENKPVLIIDTRGRSRLDEKLYTPMQKRSPVVQDGVRYLGENYRQMAQFGDWFVYELAGR